MHVTALGQVMSQFDHFSHLTRCQTAII